MIVRRADGGDGAKAVLGRVAGGGQQGRMGQFGELGGGGFADVPAFDDHRACREHQPVVAATGGGDPDQAGRAWIGNSGRDSRRIPASRQPRGQVGHDHGFDRRELHQLRHGSHRPRAEFSALTRVLSRALRRAAFAVAGNTVTRQRPSGRRAP
ncbi:hypothetical protein AWN90_11755 [Nocardia terpenica]|uniref:Uncharacterized protein n=1 Tax=Nocardia terpenica TaxID=455432 RepID=A0A164HI59_9NOCA|nr:hypothetical protein AWN90_11755 [Nocardia terpenica]